jgi:hypothetical protein
MNDKIKKFLGVLGEWIVPLIFWGGIAILIWAPWDNGVYKQGDLSNTGGSPTLRYEEIPDTNYDSNPYDEDQPTGYYGTKTIEACSTHNGSCYTLDADISGDMVERIYFPRGGWVDFDDGEFMNGSGWGIDENGREWEFSE